MTLGMHFGNCGSLYAPFQGLLSLLGITVELGYEILDINLVLDYQKSILEVLREGQLLVDVYLIWWLSASSASL